MAYNKYVTLTTVTQNKMNDTDTHALIIKQVRKGKYVTVQTLSEQVKMYFGKPQQVSDYVGGTPAGTGYFWLATYTNQMGQSIEKYKSIWQGKDGHPEGIIYRLVEEKYTPSDAMRESLLAEDMGITLRDDEY